MGTEELRVVDNGGDDPHWYALRVVPQKEYVVAYLLRRQGVRTMVPTETRWRRRTRYQKSKTEFANPEISGCVYAGFDGEPAWYHLMRNSLILGVEGMGGVPYRLDMEKLFEYFSRSLDGCKALIHVQGKGVLRPPTTRVRTISKRKKGDDFVVEATGRKAKFLAQFAFSIPEPTRAAA